MDMKKNTHGFTLIELMVVVAILAIVLSGMVKLFLDCSVLSEAAGNQTLAVSEASGKIEEMRAHPFASLVVDYGSSGSPGDTFALSDLDGIGKIYIDATNSELLEIKVLISWRNKYGRVIGEDLDLDGVLDTGEDVNGNGELDSKVQLMTMITRR